MSVRFQSLRPWGDSGSVGYGGLWHESTTISDLVRRSGDGDNCRCHGMFSHGSAAGGGCCCSGQRATAGANRRDLAAEAAFFTDAWPHYAQHAAGERSVFGGVPPTGELGRTSGTARWRRCHNRFCATRRTALWPGHPRRSITSGSRECRSLIRSAARPLSRSSIRSPTTSARQPRVRAGGGNSFWLLSL